MRNLVILSLLISPLYLSAGEIEKDVFTNTQLELVNNYIDAVNSKDINKLKSLYLEESFTCVDERTEEIVQSSLLDLPDIEYKIINFNKKLSSVSVYKGEQKTKYNWTFSTVKPSHEIDMVFEIYREDFPNYGASVISRTMIESENKWYFILYCPTEDYLKFMAEHK